MILYKDPKYNFFEYFNSETGFLIRSNVIQNKIETTQEPARRSFPELIDIGIMGTCLAAKEKFCEKFGIDCYQNAFNRQRPNMSLAQYSTIISQCSGRNFQVSLGGAGDPNKHENFNEILKITRENNIVPNLTTSGWQLSENEIDLMRKYCGAVAVSYYSKLDSSLNESNLVTVKAINDLVKAGCKTNIHYVLSLETIDEAVFRLEHDIFPEGIDAIIYLLYKPVGQAEKANVLNINNNSYRQLLKLIDERKFRYRIGFDTCQSLALKRLLPSVPDNCIDFCEASRFSMYIDCDMLAYPCSFGHEKKRNAVDLQCHTLEEAWNSSEFDLFRQNQFSKNEDNKYYQCGYGFDNCMK